MKRHPDPFISALRKVMFINVVVSAAMVAIHLISSHLLNVM